MRGKVSVKEKGGGNEVLAWGGRARGRAGGFEGARWGRRDRGGGRSNRWWSEETGREASEE